MAVITLAETMHHCHISVGGFLLIVYIPLFIDRGGGALVRQNIDEALYINPGLENGLEW